MNLIDAFMAASVEARDCREIARRMPDRGSNGSCDSARPPQCDAKVLTLCAIGTRPAAVWSSPLAAGPATPMYEAGRAYRSVRIRGFGVAHAHYRNCSDWYKTREQRVQVGTKRPRCSLRRTRFAARNAGFPMAKRATETVLTLPLYMYRIAPIQEGRSPCLRPAARARAARQQASATPFQPRFGYHL